MALGITSVNNIRRAHSHFRQFTFLLESVKGGIKAGIRSRGLLVK